MKDVILHCISILAWTLVISAITVGTSGAVTVHDYLANFVEKIEDTNIKNIKQTRVLQDDTPLSCVKLAFNGAGSAYTGDSPSMGGIATMVTNIYSEGYNGISAIDFNNMMDERGIALTYNITMDHMMVSVCALPEDIGFAIEVMTKVLTRPKLLPETIEKVRAMMLADLTYMMSNDPESVAMDEMYGSLFGTHPYANKSLGTYQSLQEIQLQDIERYISKRIILDNMLVTAVSRDLPGLLGALEKTITTLPRGEAYNVDKVDPTFFQGPIVTTMESDKTVLAFAYKGYDVHDSRYPAYAVLDALLGRPSLESMLMSAARSSGASYRVRTDAMQYEGSSLTYGFAIVEKKNKDKIIKIITNTLASVRSKIAQHEDVEAAKSYIITRAPFALMSCADKVNFLMDSMVKGLEPKQIAVYYEAISAVSAKDVLHVAQDVININKLSIVAVN